MHYLADSRISYESLMTKDVVGLGYILPNCAWVENFPWDLARALQ